MGEETPTPSRGVPIMLDRQRYLRFSLKTTREMREKFGGDKDVDHNSIAELLWYGLRHEDPELTVEQVEDMVTLDQLGEVMAAVATATGRRAVITVDGEDEKKDVDPPPQPSPDSTPEQQSSEQPVDEQGEGDAKQPEEGKPSDTS